MTASVDVLVPCYNYGRYLRECVTSILTQEGVAVRVLVIDDASTDNSGEMASALAREDRRVEVIRHVKNRGHIATYNEGIEWTRSTYWMLLSADDLLVPGALARATSVMDSHASVGLAYGRAVLQRAGAASAIVPQDAHEYLVMAGAELIRYICHTGINPVPTPTAVVRTEIQKVIGGYRPDLPHTGDMEMWMRIAAHSDVCALKACQGIYRWHGENMQFQYLRPGLKDLPEHRSAFESLFRDYGTLIPDAAPMRAAASRLLAERAFWTGVDAFEGGDGDTASACIDFAGMCDPAITTTRYWKHAQYKRIIGARVWSWLKPVYEQMRPAARSRDRQHDEPVESHNKLVGAWPEVGPRVRLESLVSA